MPRCRSWRPAPTKSRPAIFADPGQDRAQWTRCRTRVPKGQVRCAECYDLLASHPNEAIRAMLAGEQAVPEDVLAYLLDDPTAVVATAAADAMLADYPTSAHLDTDRSAPIGGDDTW